MNDRTERREALARIGKKRRAQDPEIDLDRLTWDQEYRLEIARHLKREPSSSS